MSVNISGGNKLKEFIKKIGSEKKRVVEAGFFEDSTYADKNGTKVAWVAAWNEFGTLTKSGKEHTPPRPFMSDTSKENNSKWLKTFGQQLVKSNYDVKRACNIVGLQMQGDIKNRISKANEFYAPNAPSTVAAKGKESVLRDTSIMLASVQFKVE